MSLPSAPLRFDRDYREAITLADGGAALIRCVRASDKETLRRGFARLSPESRYRRFFTSKPRLSERELEYLTDVDLDRHFALGAVRTAPDGEEIGLAVARFIRLVGRDDTVEAAIAVADDAQGNGLGRKLFERLFAAARERGVRLVQCEVLADNEPMKDFLRNIAPDARFSQHGPVALVEIAIAPAAPEPGAMIRESSLYRLLRLAAEGNLRGSRSLPDDHDGERAKADDKADDSAAPPESEP